MSVVVDSILRVNDARRSNVSDQLFRAIGSLSVASSRLGRIRDNLDRFPDSRSASGWCEFADHLQTLAGGIMTAALASHDRATTLVAADAAHRRFTMDVPYVDQLTAKLDQHVRMAHLLGYEVPSSTSGSGSTAPDSIAAFLPPDDDHTT